MRTTLLIVLAAVIGAVGVPAFGQGASRQPENRAAPAPPAPPVRRPIPFPQAAPFRGEPALLQDQDALDLLEDADLAIDPEQYRLGPGDQLAIGITARTPAAFTALVSPAGTLFIPAVGDVAVAGQNLAQARETIAAALTRVRHAGSFTVSVRLHRLRRIRVQVLGEVGKPGVYRVGATTRLLEALARAGGLTPIASRRHVQIRRGSGVGGRGSVNVKGKDVLPSPLTFPDPRPPTPDHAFPPEATLEINLERILIEGDPSGNVILESEDLIFVPRARAMVTLSGEVNRPGDYECDPGETIASLLARAGGARGQGALSAVEVERPEADDRRRLYPVDLTDGGGAFALQDRDRIVVPSIATLQGRLRVMGAVAGGGEGWLPDQDPKLPRTADVVTGTYLLRRGERVRDVIESLGGLTSKADGARARIERPDGAGGRQVIQLDLHRALVRQDPEHNPELQDGDTLIVPKKQDRVYVLGEVGRPGEQEYVEGKGVLDYVGAAGGPGTRARRKESVIVRTVGEEQKILPARLDQYLAGKKPKNPVAIQPGDIIVVPSASVRGWQEWAQITFLLRSLATGLFLFR